MDKHESAWRSMAWLLVVISLALNLRPSLTAISPLLNDIRTGVGLSLIHI